jgi:hypothetical protein
MCNIFSPRPWNRVVVRASFRENKRRLMQCVLLVSLNDTMRNPFDGKRPISVHEDIAGRERSIWLPGWRKPKKWSGRAWCEQK